MEHFEMLVIGAGPGGYVAAIRAAQLGMQVGLVESRPTLGGTCLNIGCIPSKALLESSEHFHAARHKLTDHGIDLASVELNLPQMMARKIRIVQELCDGLPLLMKKNRIKVLFGRGSLTPEGKVRIAGSEEKTIGADHIILAMGSVPVELPFLPFDGRLVVSSTEALSFEEMPEHLVVVGAGAIGLELGSVWSRLGSQVTVLELLQRIAPMSDSEISRQLQRFLSSQGISFRLGCQVSGLDRGNDGARVLFQNEKGEEESLTCERLLVAVGRRPLTEDAGLEEAGITLDEKRRVQVDSRFRTSIPNVYAIGDLIHGPMLAHKAEEDGVACAELIAGHAGHVNYANVPNVIYTWPEVAEVGLPESRAKEKGIPVKVGKFYFKANARAKSMGETDGLVKVVAHAENDRLLGVHIVGPRASDLISEAVTVMEFSGSSEDLARIIHAHPTLSEVIKEAALAVDRRAIHG